MIFKSYLSLVAMATQSMTSAATPTMKPRMMIQSGDMEESGLIKVTKIRQGMCFIKYISPRLTWCYVSFVRW